MPEWTVADPRTLTFDGGVHSLRVRLYGGEVNVVGTGEGPPRLEVTGVEGPPLLVRLERGVLAVVHRDPHGRNPLGWLAPRARRRQAVVSVALPAAVRADVGVVTATTVVSGIGGRTRISTVSGDTTLVGVTGRVLVNTVSGSVDAQSVSGDLRVNSVSGALTLVEGTGSRVNAESVSGDMVLDLAPLTASRRGSSVRLSTVSGEIAVRLPSGGDARVDAGTASGTVATAFDELRLHRDHSAKRLHGTLGRGRGRVSVNSVSGSVALLRRPPLDPDAAELEGTVL
ncbi:DUF4097 family beta strand repeat-containing protein [Streptomyces capparidis]